MARKFLYELFDKGTEQQKPQKLARADDKQQNQPPAAQHNLHRQAISVSELNRALRRQLESVFADLWVRGEISGLRQYASGHWYFSLQDKGAQIPAVMFAADNRRLKFSVRDGDAVFARGRMSFYDKSGRAQLIVRQLEASGDGARALAQKQLEQKLRREGLFDDQNKKPLPLCPTRLGVVTSPDGAALHDIISVSRRRFANMPILLSPTRVQGQAAAQEIAQALRRLDNSGRCDLIIVGRGGGSEEDLSVFSSEVVVRAVAACHTPVISAVGHEVDVALCDHAADLRAATPSAAAEHAVPIKDELKDELQSKLLRAQKILRRQINEARLRLDSLRQVISDPTLLIYLRRQDLDQLLLRMQHLLQKRAQQKRHQLKSLQLRLAAQHPRTSIAQQAHLLSLQRGALLDRIWQIHHRQNQHLDALRLHMHRQVRDKCSAQRRRLSVISKQLQALSPLLVLARGYAVVQKEQAVVHSCEQIKRDDELTIRFERGRAKVLVTEVDHLNKG